jgi:PAS domain S-box-containing protein
VRDQRDEMLRARAADLEAKQEALTQSEDRWHAIADNSPAVILLRDTERRYINANKFWHDMYNPEGEDIVGKTSYDVLPADLAGRLEALDRQVLETGKPRTEEMSLADADGELRNFVCSRFPVRSGDGAIAGIGIVYTDITERVAAERAQRESDERFSLAMQGANDGLWDWNLKTNEFYFSPRWFTMLGYEPFELPAKFDTWATLVDPEAKHRTLELAQDYISGAAEKFETEFRMRHRDGSWVDIWARAFLVRKDGEPLRLVGTHVDITERKRIEQALTDSRDQLRLIADNLPVSIAYIDADQRYRFINETGARWRGQPAEEIIGRSLPEVFGGYYENIKPRLEATLAGEIVGIRERLLIPTASSEPCKLSTFRTLKRTGGSRDIPPSSRMFPV